MNGWQKYSAVLITPEEDERRCERFKNELPSVVTVLVKMQDSNLDDDQKVDKALYQFFAILRQRNNHTLKHWAAINTMACIAKGDNGSGLQLAVASGQALSEKRTYDLPQTMSNTSLSNIHVLESQ